MAANTAFITWNAITLNADATPCTDLAFYKISFGQIPGVYTNTVTVPAGQLSQNLDFTTGSNDGLWYFAVSGIDTTGNEGVKTLTTPPSKRIIRVPSKIRRVH